MSIIEPKIDVLLNETDNDRFPVSYTHLTLPTN